MADRCQSRQVVCGVAAFGNLRRWAVVRRAVFGGNSHVGVVKHLKHLSARGRFGDERRLRSADGESLRTGGVGIWNESACSRRSGVVAPEGVVLARTVSLLREWRA
jgi:hypothetical protein